MAEYPSILSLLEAERERYILEAASLERRLQHVRHQIVNLEALIWWICNRSTNVLNPKTSFSFIIHTANPSGELYGDHSDREHLDLSDALRRGRTEVVNQALRRRSSRKDHLLPTAKRQLWWKWFQRSK